MPRQRRQRTSLLAPLVLVAALSAGCAGRSVGDPISLPGLGPATSTATPHLAAAGPARTTRAQAAGVVRRYFDALNQLRVRMRAASLARLFTAECPCQQQARAIGDAAARGERYVDRIRINAVRPNLDGHAAADVLVDYNLVRGERIDAAGRILSRTPPRRVWWDFRLVRRGPRWLIARIDAIA